MRITPVLAVLVLVAAAGIAAQRGPAPATAPTRAPGASAVAEGVAPDAPTSIGDPVVLRDRPTSFAGDLRDVPRSHAPATPPEDEGETRPAAPAAPVADAVLQAAEPLAAAPSATVTDGLSLGPGGGWPPDPSIDVGPNHVIEAVNRSWAVYGRTSRALLASGTFNALIDGTGTPCDTANQGDPVVLYDSIADRWILTDFAFTSLSAGPYYQCFAVSKTADPVAGGWWFYAFETGQPPAGGTGNYLPDYPKLGVWPDGVYMTANMFTWDPVAHDMQMSNGRLFAFNRAAMEAGQASSAVAIDLAYPSFNLLPAHARVATGLPPTGAPGYAVETWLGNTLRVWRFAVDWATPGNSSVTGSNVNVAAYTAPPAYAPTPGLNIETLDDVPMMQLQYSAIGGAQSLWLTHTVGAGGATGLRWYQLDVSGAPAVAQQSTWAPADGVYRFMPSLGVDRLGDMAIGYSASSATVNPGIRYAGRLAGDPAGTLTLDEQVLQAGGGTQTTYTRWGDYSAMALDPSDGCTFWYANEYYPTTGTTWHTAIGSFAYPGCTTPTPAAPEATPDVAPTPVVAPAPELRAAAVRTATRRALESGLKVSVAPSAAGTVTIVVRARGRVVGRLTRTVAATPRILSVPLRRTWLRTVRKGAVLQVLITGKTPAGAAFTPTTTFVRVR